jgi:hypothetical protein
MQVSGNSCLQISSCDFLMNIKMKVPLDQILINVLSRYRVTIDRVWSSNQIYWTLKQLVTMIYKSLSHTRLVFSVTVFTALLGSSFQWWMFPFLWIPKLSLASTTSISLLTTANLNWLTACRLSLTLYSSTHNGSWSLLYSLGMERTENTASNHSSVIALASVVAHHATATEPLPSNGHVCRAFPSNSCLCWLHSSVLSKYVTV